METSIPELEERGPGLPETMTWANVKGLPSWCPDSGPGMGLSFKGTMAAPSVLQLAKWWLPVAAAWYPSSAQRSVEAKLGEVATCRRQEPPEQGRGSSELKAETDTSQSPSLCQSNQSSGQPLPPGSFPSRSQGGPAADRSWVPQMKSSVLVPGKGRAGGSKWRGHRARTLSAFPRLAPQVGKPGALSGECPLSGGWGL